MENWTHEKTFLALLEKDRSLLCDLNNKNLYVKPYEQEQNSALLFSPFSNNKEAPIHLNPNSKSWKSEIINTDSKVLEYHSNVGHNFHSYKVKDWNKLASILGL